MIKNYDLIRFSCSSAKLRFFGVGKTYKKIESIKRSEFSWFEVLFLWKSQNSNSLTS